MSAVMTSSLSDTLPLTVPRLDAKGENWGIFFVHFMDAVKAKGFWDHFNSTSSAPVLSATATAAKIAVKAQWNKDE